MATPDEIDLAEEAVCRFIEVAKRQGLNSRELEDIFLRAYVNLHIAATCEYRIKGGT